MAGKDSKRMYINIGNHEYSLKKEEIRKKSNSTSAVHNIALP
jgi:hypothetical protein